MSCASMPIGATSFQVNNASADATGGMTVIAGVVGKRPYITDLIISTDTETSIEVQVTGGTPMMQQMYFPAPSIWSKTFYSVPLSVFNDGDGVRLVAADAGNVTVTALGWLV